MKLCYLVLFIVLINVITKKFKKKLKKDDHLIENKELYEFHNIKQREKKESGVDHNYKYKEITEENYEGHNMGYHNDYSPIEETR